VVKPTTDRASLANAGSVALSRTTREPTRYLVRVKIDQPFLAADGSGPSLALTTLQPGGSDRTQGTREAGLDPLIGRPGRRVRRGVHGSASVSVGRTARAA
jgi:hypothetical protein